MTAALLAWSAERDMLDAIRWIVRDSPAAARALRVSITRASAAIGEHPHIGSLRPELVEPPYRCFPLTGLPYVLVYNPDRQPPLIIRILHGARNLPEILRDLDRYEHDRD